MAKVIASASLQQYLEASIRDQKVKMSSGSHSNATLQHFIKQTCSSFSQWRPWQQRILLCGMTNRCSVHQLELLASALEPIFHRDFATALTGSYPKSPLRQKIIPEQKHKTLERLKTSDSAAYQLDKRTFSRSRSQHPSTSRSLSRRSSGTGNQPRPYNEITRDSERGNISGSSASRRLSQTRRISGGRQKQFQTLKSQLPTSEEITSSTVQSLTTLSPSRVVSADIKSIDECPIASSESCDRNLRLVASSFESFNIHSESRTGESKSNTLASSLHAESLDLNPVSASMLPLRGKLAHNHLPSYASSSNVSGPNASTKSYFASQDSRDNFADIRGKIMPTLTKLAMGTYFLAPQRGRLAERFRSQLQEIWQYLESLDDQQHADILHALIKSSDPSLISFLSYCLFQRLHDHSNIDSLPDAVLQHVFSYLNSYTLCHCAQVCKRWRYLSLLRPQWQQRLNDLGSSKGVQDLNKALEEGSKDRHIDWRRAYQEMSTVNWHDTRAVMNQTNSIGEDCGDRNGSGLLTDLLSVDNADLDLRTLLLIAKINGIEEEQMHTSSLPVPKFVQVDGQELSPGNASSASSHKEGSLTGQRSGPNKKDSVMKAGKDAAGNEKGKHKGSDFIVLFRSDEMKQAKTQQRSTPVTTKKVEKPKLLSIALDVRLPKTATTHPCGYCILGLAGIAVDDEDSNYMLSLLRNEVIDVRNVRRVEGHAGVVSCASFDIRRLITGSLDRTLRVSDIRSGRILAILGGHKGGVHCVQFDNKKIVTGSWDMTCKVWDAVRFGELRTLTGHRGYVSAMKLNGDILVTGSHDRTLRIWNTCNWLCQRVIIAHDSYINCLDSDGMHCVSGSSDRTLKLWEVESGQCLQVFSGHKDSVLCCRMQEKLLASGCASGSVYLWNFSTGENLVQLNHAHTGAVSAIVFKDTSFFTGGSDCHIKEWHMASCSCVRSLQGHTGSINTLEIVNERLVSCSADWTTRIWETNPPVLQLGSMYTAQHYDNIAVRKVISETKSSNENSSD